MNNPKPCVSTIILRNPPALMSLPFLFFVLSDVVPLDKLLAKILNLLEHFNCYRCFLPLGCHARFIGVK